MKILHNVDFHSDIASVLQDFIKKKALPLSTNGLHFGNCCLINIPDELLPEIMALNIKDNCNNNLIQYRNRKNIIEAEDILRFAPGEKITIKHLDTDFFPVKNERGTVHSVSVHQLAIRAYRKQNKGWFIRPGNNAILVKGWTKCAQ